MLLHVGIAPLCVGVTHPTHDSRLLRISIAAPRLGPWLLRQPAAVLRSRCLIIVVVLKQGVLDAMALGL